MAITDEVNQLKRRVDALKTQRARDEGALEPLMKKLKDEFGCTTIEQARAAHAKLKTKLAEKQQALQDTVATLDQAITSIEMDVEGR